MASALAQDWHSSTECYEAVKSFHDRRARQPNMTEARRIHEMYTNEIAVALRSNGTCHRLEYTGSSYEGVKVHKTPDDADLEFDVMVILRGGQDLTAEQIYGKPGFVTLRRRVQMQAMSMAADSSGRILASNTTSEFCSELQKIINKSANMKEKVKLRLHGPALQMDVYQDNTQRQKIYSVDMVPTYEVGGCLFVAKPLKGESTDLTAWRRSFSLQEKEKFEAMDRDNGCRKQVLRVLKAIRNKEVVLNQMTSYHLKTALFREVQSTNDWSYNRLGLRVLGVLKRLEDALTSKYMEHFFLPEINLLATMTPSSIVNMGDRIRRLRSSKEELLRVMRS